MSRRPRTRTLLVSLAMLVVSLPLALGSAPSATAIPNPVATNMATYLAYGRVFPDPHGCRSVDIDGDDVNDVVSPATSPWAKGNVCVTQFLSYEEVVEGTKFLATLFPRFVEVIRLDEAYDNPAYMSAGIPRAVVIEDGTPKFLGRDRRPLYLFKITDNESKIPESERLHFIYGLSIHGIERAGLEGGIRAMEDLVTWAANLPDKPIVEAETERPVPTAAEVLERSVIYFHLANPDGWARGQVGPTEFEDGSPNLNYNPGVAFQRYNGNGMDLNRDYPTVGYTYRPYTPGSEPETRAFTEVLRGIRRSISPKNPVGKRFAGSIDLHGQIDAPAFSFTLVKAGQNDFRANSVIVETGLRTWEDQTTRLEWSPYIGAVDGLMEVADQWGTVIDTIGYQVTGSLGDWYGDEKIGLGAVAVDNEMTLSHLAPNTVYEPTLEQMHIDGNKGLIYSQLAALLTQEEHLYEPAGKIGYVFNPLRIENKGTRRPPTQGFPAQPDIDVLVPCQSAGPQDNDLLLPCDEEGVTFGTEGQQFMLEFDVKGPKDGFWNGGISATMTNLNVLGISHGTIARILLERLEKEGWETVQQSFVQAGAPDLYVPGGQSVAVNDPIPGRWRVRISNAAAGPSRVTIDFRHQYGEMSSGQAPFSVSSMDFFEDLNDYIEDPKLQVEALTVEDIARNPSILGDFDSLVVVNRMGERKFLSSKKDGLGLSGSTVARYFAGLKAFASGGGNLVLTDAALQALGEMKVVKNGDVLGSLNLAGRYEFEVDGEFVCNKAPLTRDVCLPGTAGGTSRQAVEPTPLGYIPDFGMDNDVSALMPQWAVVRDAWEKGCKGTCTSAFIGEGDPGLGERPFGKGVVRIAGIMFPDPQYEPGGPRDMRFGLVSYALAFSTWQIFLNLVDYKR